MNEENERRVNVRMARRQQQKKESRMRLIKIGSAVAVFLILASAVVGLYFYGKNQSSAKSAEVKTSKTTSPKVSSMSQSTDSKETQSTTQVSEQGNLRDQLQKILTVYTQKIKDQTPRLIEEYQAEIQNNQNGAAGLSAIANQKARALQAISDEGIHQLQTKYQTAQKKEDVDLSMWVKRLSAIYTEYVAKISDIYLQTSASLQAETLNSQETSESEIQLSQTMESSTTPQSSVNQESQGQSTKTSSSEQHASETTVVQPGEGPNQIAQRTGVPVEKILSLNGMTMDDYFFNPGDVLKLK